VFVTFTIQCAFEKIIEQKNVSSFKWDSNLHISSVNSVNSCCATTYTKSQDHYNESITGHKKLKKLDNVKIDNLKRKNRDHEKVPKQDEDAGNLQILLHLRSLF